MSKHSDRPAAGDLLYPGYLCDDEWVLIHHRTGAFIRKARPNKQGIRETVRFKNPSDAIEWALSMGYTVKREEGSCE